MTSFYQQLGWWAGRVMQDDILQIKMYIYEVTWLHLNLAGIERNYCRADIARRWSARPATRSLLPPPVPSPLHSAATKAKALLPRRPELQRSWRQSRCTASRGRRSTSSGGGRRSKRRSAASSPTRRLQESRPRRSRSVLAVD